MAPMNNRLLRPLQAPGLLDLVPGAAAAYSLRSLSRSYAGPVVTVRRSSDDAEDSFTASEVSDGTLAAFCGAGNGFVKQWWDQSGNGNHAVAPADASEPQIVDSGVVVTEEGKPALQFDGSDDWLVKTGFPSFASLTVANVSTSTAYEASNENSIIAAQWVGGDVRKWIQSVAEASDFFVSSSVEGTAGTAYANGGLSVSSSLGIQLLGFSTFTGLNTGTSAQLTIAVATGAGGTARGTFGDLTGTIQELVIWPSDLTPQRETIEGNIAWSYSV